MASLAEEILADNPYIYWPLDDGPGTTVLDASPNLRNGTTSGATLGVSDPTFCTVAEFDGVNDTISRTLGATIQTLAVEVWFNSDVTINAGGSSYYGLVDGGAGTFSFALGEITGSLTDERTTLYQTTGSRFWAETGSGLTFPSGTWHHAVAAWVDADNDWGLFIDSTQVDNVQLGGAVDGSMGMDLFRLGRWISGGGYFDGRMAHAAMYTTELTPARIAAHHSASPKCRSRGWTVGGVAF